MATDLGTLGVPGGTRNLDSGDAFDTVAATVYLGGTADVTNGSTLNLDPVAAVGVATTFDVSDSASSSTIRLPASLSGTPSTSEARPLGSTPQRVVDLLLRLHDEVDNAACSRADLSFVAGQFSAGRIDR
jgi:hypothetical protein